jgi:hypothetical protein
MRARAEVDRLPTSGKEPKRMAAGFVLLEFGGDCSFVFVRREHAGAIRCVCQIIGAERIIDPIP